MKESFRIGLISPYSNISAMGLRQLSACLKQAGWDTRMVFLPDPAEWLFEPPPPSPALPAGGGGTGL